MERERRRLGAPETRGRPITGLGRRPLRHGPVRRLLSGRRPGHVPYGPRGRSGPVLLPSPPVSPGTVPVPTGRVEGRFLPVTSTSGPENPSTPTDPGVTHSRSSSLADTSLEWSSRNLLGGRGRCSVLQF